MRCVAFLVLLSTCPYVALAAGAELRLNKNGVALCEGRDSKKDGDCYDPVAYFDEGKAVKVEAEAASRFRFQFGGATYVFKNQKHLDAFKENPERYAPQFGGWCAYAVAAKKDKVDVDPKSFLVQDGRLLLFYDSFVARTRKTWTTDKSKSADAYLKEADKNWPEVKTKEI